MRYFKKDYDSIREIFLEDKFLSQHCDEFAILINSFIKSEKDELIINFYNATALDTSGLGSLLLGLQKINDANKKLILRNPRNDVKSALKLLNFETLFEIEFAD